MRANNRANILRYAVLLVPMVLAGCKKAEVDCTQTPDDPACSKVPSTLEFPSCSDGSLIGIDKSGQMTCQSAPVGKVDIPGCTANQAITSDGTKLLCVDKAMGGNENPNNMRITTISTKVDKLTMQATEILNKGGGVLATFKGITTNSYNGNFQLITGAINGFDGAAKACAAQYGVGAHMCTAAEIYQSAISGIIGMGVKEITKSWVYFPTWTNPLTGSQDPLLGMGDTCGSLTYPTNDLKWSGVAVSTGALKTTRWGVRFHGGSEALCNAPLPIACCNQ